MHMFTDCRRQWQLRTCVMNLEFHTSGQEDKIWTGMESLDGWVICTYKLVCQYSWFLEIRPSPRPPLAAQNRIPRCIFHEIWVYLELTDKFIVEFFLGR